MGKSKNKRSKQATETVPFSSRTDVGSILPGPSRAIDGHDTQGWTDNEIRAYNGLVIERQKLEKQRYELEEKCAKSQTQRALLDENMANIDNVFNQLNAVSPVAKFTGRSNCCVDLNTNSDCHHEVCKRAKTEGVTVAELDTLKYYSMRINQEKSERIRNALRKQRDLELIRVQKEKEVQLEIARKATRLATPSYGDISNLGGRGSRNKDVSRAARETEKIVNRIIHQLDDLRSDLQTGKISAEEAQGKLNVLDSKLPVIQDKAGQKSASEGGTTPKTVKDINSTTESLQSHLRERLLNAKGDTFSQAFSIMNHFLSATRSDDLQEAISELKDILQLSGPMCNELQSSLGALEGIFDNPDKLSFTGPDGKQECSSIIDLMEKLKDTLKRTGQLPDGANASLTKVFQECINLEVDAKDQLTLRCSDELTTSADLPAALTQIKDEYVAKSPIPPLTSKRLDLDIANLLDVYDARQLIIKARSGAKPIQLEAQMTTLVITRTQRRPEKYVEKLERLDIACRSASALEGSEIVREAIGNVLKRVKKWTQALASRKKTQPENNSNTNGQPLQSPISVGTSAKSAASSASSSASVEVPANMPMPLSEVLTQFPHDPAIQTQDTIRASITKNGKYGLWDNFEDYRQKTLFAIDTPMLHKAESYKGNTRSMIEDEAFGVKATVCYLYKLKLCPGFVAVLISQVLLDITEYSEDNGRAYMKQLSGCMDGLPPPVSPDWSNTFRRLSLAMVQLYVASYVESLAAFPTASALNLAMNTLMMVTTSVNLTRTSQASHNNLKVMTGFILACFSGSVSRHVPSLQDAIAHYRHFCVTDTFRCITIGPCSKHMHFTKMPFKPLSTRTKPYRSSHDTVPDSRLAAHRDINGRSYNSTIVTDSILTKPRLKTRLIKTMVCYPPGHQAERQLEPKIRKRDTRFAESLKTAAALYKSTARKALATLQLRVDDYDTRKALPPADLVAAIDEILSATKTDDDFQTDDTKNEKPSSTPNSRFSEHLDKPLNSADMAVQGALNAQLVFRQLQNETLGTAYLKRVSDSVKRCALSGRYPNPTEVASGYASSIMKLGNVPASFKDALLKTKNEITTALKDANECFVYETRRLKHLLGMVNASEPSIPALFRLATKIPPAFHEYHEIISDKVDQKGKAKVGMLEQWWSDVTQLATTMSLKEDAPSLIGFVDQAVEDWAQRPRTITNYTSETADDVCFSHEDGDISGIVAQSLASLKDNSPTITKSPAKQPVVEKQSWKASAVASCALISSPDLSTRSRRATNSTKDRLLVPDTSGIDRIGNALAETRMFHGVSGNFDTVAPEALASTFEQAMNTGSNDNRAGFGENTNEINVPHNQNASTTSFTSEVEQQYRKPIQAQISPTRNEPVSSKGTGLTEKSASTSTPAAIRTLDMVRQLAALQANSTIFSGTTGEMEAFNKEHGKVARRLAERLAAQITSYMIFVRQIAEWNGVDLAKE